MTPAFFAGVISLQIKMLCFIPFPTNLMQKQVTIWIIFVDPV